MKTIYENKKRNINQTQLKFVETISLSAKNQCIHTERQTHNKYIYNKYIYRQTMALTVSVRVYLYICMKLIGIGTIRRIEIHKHRIEPSTILFMQSRQSESCLLKCAYDSKINREAHDSSCGTN